MTTVQVYLEWGAPEDETEAVNVALREAGIDANVRAGVMQFHQQPPWLIVIEASTISMFLGGYIGAAGADAWRGTKELVRRLYAARRGERGAIRVETKEHKVFLRPDLPDDAFRQLHEPLAPGWYEWDDEAHRWERRGP